MNSDYSDESFWEKVKRFAAVAGKEVIEVALCLYYAAQSPETPNWAKAVIYSTLAYFILPTDAIPDAIPVVGYSDDLSALAAALGAVAMYITDEVEERARKKTRDWFGDQN